MRFVALVSGGKDSVFSLGKCLAHGHELVCLANLYPPDTGPEELDSFMFQSAGATALEALAECLGVPLLRAPLRGRSGHQGLHYAVTEGDEVEDLYELLRHVKVGCWVALHWIESEKLMVWAWCRCGVFGCCLLHCTALHWRPPIPADLTLITAPQLSTGDVPRRAGRGERRRALHLPAHARRERLRAPGAPVAGLLVAGGWG